MDQNPGLGTRFPPNLEQLVDDPFASSRLGEKFLELFISRHIASRPVDFTMDSREAKLQERLEVKIERFLPGTIILRHDLYPMAVLSR